MSQKRFWMRLFAILLPIVTLVIWYQQESNPNVRFRRLQKEFEEAYQATYSPLFDSLQLGIIEPKNLQERNRLFTYYQLQLAVFKTRNLQTIYQKQWQQTFNLIETQLIYLPKLRKDPTLYNFGTHLKKTLQLKDAPLNNRLQQIEKQLQNAPLYYTTAKDNLTAPDSTKLKSAIQQQLQTLHFLQHELLDSLRKARLPEVQHDTLLTRTVKAKIAVKDYLAFCRSLEFEYGDSSISNQ